MKSWLRRWLYWQLHDEIQYEIHRIVNSELLASDCCCSALPHRYP